MVCTTGAAYGPRFPGLAPTIPSEQIKGAGKEKVDRITLQPELMGGRACIRGMRVTVGMIVGQIGAGSEIMAYAVERGLVVLSHDLDFGAMLAAGAHTQPSVVQVRAGNLSPSVIGDQVLAAPRQMSDELLAGALLTIDNRRTRLRLLPLQR